MFILWVYVWNFFHLVGGPSVNCVIFCIIFQSLSKRHSIFHQITRVLKKFDPLPANHKTPLINTPYFLFAFLGFDGGFFYCFKSRFSRNYKNFMRISRYPEMVRKLWWNCRGNDSGWIWKLSDKLSVMTSKNFNMPIHEYRYKFTYNTLRNFPRFSTPSLFVTQNPTNLFFRLRNKSLTSFPPRAIRIIWTTPKPWKQNTQSFTSIKYYFRARFENFLI